jgi:hypothetical protein
MSDMQLAQARTVRLDGVAPGQIYRLGIFRCTCSRWSRALLRVPPCG